MQKIKQSTARNVVLKLYLADYVTEATGKTLTVTLSKDGNAFAAVSGSVSEIANGWYKVALNSTDTNTLGELAIRATATACDNAERLLEIVSYDPQSATNLGLSNLDAASSTLATAAALTTVDDFLDTEVAAIKAKTDNLPAAPAAAGDIPSAAAIRAEIDANSTKLDVAMSTRLADADYTEPPTATENADALLKRDWTAVTGEAARSVLNALRAIRNKVSRSGATVTITKEDDSTTAWTGALTTDAAAEPVTAVDPS